MAPIISVAGDGDALPAEILALKWPVVFSAAPTGERLELFEDGACATRTSGVGRGACFVGPLCLDRGPAYFEIEVLELVPSSQSLALGIFTRALPEKLNLPEKVKDLGKSTILMGYDLPKLYVHGKEVGKNFSREWRPSKELIVGDRVGLLVERASMRLTIFVNGCRRVAMDVPESSGRWPAELWGVVDVHGAVKSVRLVGPDLADKSPCNAPIIPQLPLEPQMMKVEDDRRSSTGSQKRAALPDDAAAGKRPRLFSHPCGCSVHLMSHAGRLVHVPVADFLIGRDPKRANLVLDSQVVPNMVSRQHARILSIDDGVEVADCDTANGTWVEGVRVEKQMLQHRDTICIGQPDKTPSDLRFSVLLP